MSEEHILKKFKTMNVASIKKYVKERGVTVNGYLKPALVAIAAAVEKMMLPLDPNYERDNNENNLHQRLLIHEMQIANPFTIKTQNNFIDSPPLGLYDIFNHLIYHATEYDKQGLAAYKSYEYYRLFEDGYVESLEKATLLDPGLHLYVGKVLPTMRGKTDDGKDWYELWFILEGKGPNKGSILEAFRTCKGGRDGWCKHISAALYLLEELVNSTRDKSVTSGPCKWVRKPWSNTGPYTVKNLEILKGTYIICNRWLHNYLGVYFTYERIL